MGEGLADIVISHVLTDCELSWEYLPLIKELKKMTEEEPLPDQSCLSSAEVRAGKGLLWVIWGMREQFWEPWVRHWSIPFPLDLKAQHGFWDQRSETHPVEGVAVGRVLRGWG